MSARHPLDPSDRPPPERSVLKLPQSEAQSQLDARIGAGTVFTLRIDTLISKLDSEVFPNRHASRRRSEELAKLEREISEWRADNRKWLGRYLGGEAAEEYRYVSARGSAHIAGDQRADLCFLSESIVSDIEKLESIRYRLPMWRLENYIASAPIPSQPQSPPQPATTSNDDPRPTAKAIAAWLAGATVQPQSPQRSIPAATSAPAGGQLPISSSSAQGRDRHAFISYVREDSHRVEALQQALQVAGVRVWRDKDDLWPGDDWRMVISRAITHDTLVFIACFSSHSAARTTSYQNEEISLAVEQFRLRPPNARWLIPVRFDDCQLPPFSLGPGRTLDSIQRADLFGVLREAEMERLVTTVRGLLSQPPFG